jgi:hypothetical protein
MRRAFMYTSIGLIVLMLFVSNSAVASSFGDDYSANFSVATEPGNILGSNDNKVCSLGTVSINDGCIVVLFDDEFRDGQAFNDIIIYAYDVDSESEQFSVHCGIYIDEFTPMEDTLELIWMYDTDGTTPVSMEEAEGDWNSIMLVTAEDSGNGGTWPGPEVDAVWVQYD